MSIRKIVLLLLIFSSQIHASDWPIYKGNIYFTANNDEIVVPNGNLKWLFQAGDRVYNPVVSDGRIYFIDHSAHLYCLDERSGRFIWKISVRDISRQFKSLSRAAGKIKNPLIQGDFIYLTDPVAVYCLNKWTGKTLWARTGDNISKIQGSRISGIYSDPILSGSNIYYGTRKSFVSRRTNDGHTNWANTSIQSYSGFPTFYDDFILVQSMNYETNKFHIVMLNSKTGTSVWKQELPVPFKIFAPVVYNSRIYIPISKNLYCLRLNDGSLIWNKEYSGILSSAPSFTDRSIVITEDNSRLLLINPTNGMIAKKIEIEKKSSPYYAMIRNQIYISYNTKGAAERTYGQVRAMNFNNESILWTFRTPFPGAVSQPVASRGILFLPAGNYIYAIGARSYPRNVQGGSSVDETPRDLPQNQNSNEDEQIKLREYKIKVTGDNSREIPARVSIQQQDENGELNYSKDSAIVNGMIMIPEEGEVHVVVGADGYVPKGFSPEEDEEGREITLTKLERGQNFIIDDITFETDSAYLKRNSLPVLKQLLAILDKNPKLNLEIGGHTDNQGTTQYNQNLSEKRADAVAEYLIKNGISPERISSTGYGESKPLATNETNEGREKNRRTEFVFR